MRRVLATVAVVALGMSTLEVPAIAASGVDVALDVDVTDLVAASHIRLGEVPPTPTATQTITESGEDVGSTPLTAIDMSSTPLTAIPLTAIPLTAIPLTAIDLASTSLDALPLSEIPVEGGWEPILAGTQFASAPLYLVSWSEAVADETVRSRMEALELGDLHLELTPLGQLPLAAIVMGNIPIHDLPLGPELVGGSDQEVLTDWCAFLAGVGYPCDAMGINPAAGGNGDATLMALSLAGIPLTAIPLTAIPLTAIPLTAIGLQSTPLTAIPLTAIDLQASPLTAIPLTAIPLTAIPLTAIPLTAIPLTAIPLTAIPLTAIPLTAIDIVNTPLTAIPLTAIDPAGVDCDAPGLDCSTDTLGEAAALDALRGHLGHLGDAVRGIRLSEIFDQMTPEMQAQLLSELGTTFLGDVLDWDDVLLGEVDEYGDTTLADLIDVLPAFILDGLTLEDLFASILAYTDYPWSNLDLDQLDVPALASDGFGLTYTAAAEPIGAPWGTATLAVDLPPGFRYVEGTARIAQGGGAIGEPVVSTSLGETDTQTLRWSKENADLPPGRITFAFDVLPSTTLRDGVATLTVTNGGDVGADTALTRVHESLEPNDKAGEAVPVVDESLYVSQLSSGKDVDLFRLDLERGERISINLSNLEADLDLVLYAPSDDARGRPTTDRVLPLQDAPNQIVGRKNFQLDSASEDDVTLSATVLASPEAHGVYAISSRRPLPLDAADPYGPIEQPDEFIDTPPVPRAGTYYVQVSAHKGAYADAPYALRIKRIPAPTLPECAPRPPTQYEGEGDAWLSSNNQMSWPIRQDGSNPKGGSNTLYVVNEFRFAETYGATALESIMSTLMQTDGRGDAGNVGVWSVDTGWDRENPTTIQAAYEAWDRDRCDPDLANDVVDLIAERIDQFRAAMPIRHVVMIGGDELLPMGRVVDRALIANEFTYGATFADNNELVGALGTGHVLTDDVYADSTPTVAGTESLYVPEVAIGRLVEYPEQILATLQNFTEHGGRLDLGTATRHDPYGTGARSRALVTGYDFLVDGALEVQQALEATTGLAGDPYDAEDPSSHLIHEAWSARDLYEGLFARSSEVAVASINAHFDHFQSLPASGNASHNHDDLFTVDDVVRGVNEHGDGPLDRALLFSMGCHSGLAVPDVQILGSKEDGVDWASTMMDAEAAGWVGNTGYGYGDTEVVAYSELLMREFSLRVANHSIGRALALAKQRFTAELGAHSPYEEKASMEATLYGLPMWIFPDEALDTIDPEPPVYTTGGPRTIQGTTPTSTKQEREYGNFVIRSTDRGDIVTWTEEIRRPGSRDNETYLVEQVQATSGRPVQPRIDTEITKWGQEGNQKPLQYAKGAWLTGLTQKLLPDFDPVLSRPVIDFDATSPEPDVDALAYPNQFLRIGSYEDEHGLRQQVEFVAGHFKGQRCAGSSACRLIGAGTEFTGLQRVFEQHQVEVFYVPETVGPEAEDVVPPRIEKVSAFQQGNGDFRFDLVSDPTAVAANVLWIEVGVDGPWNVRTLTPRGDGVFDGTAAPKGAKEIEYFVQVRDANGNVATSTDRGWFHGLMTQAEVDRNPTTVSPGLHGLVLTDGSGSALARSGRWYPETVYVKASGPDVAQLLVTLDGKVVAEGKGSDVIPLGDSGEYLVQFVDGSGEVVFGTKVRVDREGPTIQSLRPRPNGQVIQGSSTVPEFTCEDAHSGVATCTVDGPLLQTGTTGVGRLLTLRATDHVGNSTVVPVPYDVVRDPGPPVEHCTDDDREDDDTFGASALLPNDGQELGGVLCDQADWFQFEVQSGAQIDATLTAYAAQTTGDLDLTLYGADGTTVLASTDDQSTDVETLAHTATTTGTHYLKVWSSEGATGTYTVGAAETPVEMRRFEESDPAMGFSSGWLSFSSGARSGGAMRYSAVVGARLAVGFDGSMVRVVSSRGPSRGIAEVFIDGVSQGLVDLYASSWAYQQVVFEASGLSSGGHLLEVVVTGTRHASAGSNHVEIDAVEATSVSPWVRVEESDPAMGFSSGWLSFSSGARSGGAMRYSAVVGARLAVGFDGSMVRVVSSRGPSRGIAEVFIDGVSQGLVDLYASSWAYQQVVFEASGLSSGGHLLEVVVTGTRHASAGSNHVEIDAVEATSVSPWVRVEESDPAMGFSSGWLSFSSGARSGGAMRYSAVVGARLAVGFDGSMVRVVSSRGPSRGIAEVFIDGVSQGLVDLYASSWAYQQVVFEASGLSSGGHLLEVVVTGTRHASAGSNHVEIDAVEATSVSPWVRVEESDPAMGFSSGWLSFSSGARSGGAMRYSAVVGARLAVGFDGSMVRVVSSRGPSRGIAEVFIDGVSQGLVDLYASSWAYQQVVFEASGLSSGGHLLEVVVTGTRHASAGSNHVEIDAVEATSVSPWVRVEESDPAMGFSSGWLSFSSGARSGGAMRYSAVVGARLAVGFDGSMVRVVSSRGPSRGIAEVFIDGVSQGLVDLYASSWAYQQVVFEASGLSSGGHLLEVVVTGTRHASAGSNHVEIDAVEATSVS